MADENFDRYRRKIKTAAELRALLGPRPRAHRVIMCHGVFDIVHPGHIRHLLYAKSKADVLVASITADQHIIKGNVRPYVPEELRALNLAAFEMVDHVLIDPDPTPLANLRLLQPDYFAKGYEYVKGTLNPRTQEEIAVLESYGGEMLFTPGDVVYSSSQLIEAAPPDLACEKLLLLMRGEGIGFADLGRAVGRLAGVRVHVLGDTIVDGLVRCSMIGGGSKTPTLSARFEESTDFVGGAAVVARHLRAAGAAVTFSTVLGEDAPGRFVLEALRAEGIDARPALDPTRPTTAKTVYAVDGYRLLKVDRLDNRGISERIQRQLVEQVRDTPADVVIFSDFRHGLFNRATIPALTAAIPAGVFRVADSQVASRWGNVLDFQGFDLLTPNEREARFALADQDSTVRPLGSELYRRAGCRTLMLKLGDRGMITFRDAGPETRNFFTVDSFAEKAVDPVGAGDALLAYAALALATSGSPALASILGSIAAALECERDGNIPIAPADVLARIDRVARRAEFR